MYHLTRLLSMGTKVSLDYESKYELIGEGVFEFESGDKLFLHGCKKIININTFELEH